MSAEKTEYQTVSPVLFLIFNRPDTTQQVFDVIRKAGPTRLYIAADGPRSDRAGEQEKCEAVRAIATGIDWNCRVETLFRDENLGCGTAVSEAITWFFNHEEEGIILEDDCLPEPSFFRFVDELLDRYRHDNRIAVISGDNFQIKPRRGRPELLFFDVQSRMGLGLMAEGVARLRSCYERLAGDPRWKMACGCAWLRISGEVLGQIV